MKKYFHVMPLFALISWLKGPIFSDFSLQSFSGLNSGRKQVEKLEVLQPFFVSQPNSSY